MEKLRWTTNKSANEDAGYVVVKDPEKYVSRKAIAKYKGMTLMGIPKKPAKKLKPKKVKPAFTPKLDDPDLDF